MKKIFTNKKGFTLMEVIVVLIIIAVLAAALIPSFIGFVNQSRAATDIAAARVGMTAAQVEVTHLVAAGTPIASIGDTQIKTGRFTDAVSADTTGAASFTVFTIDAQGHVTGLQYAGTRYNVTISPAGTDYTLRPTTP